MNFLFDPDADSGTLKQQTAQVVNDIGAYLLRRTERYGHIGLYSGDSGVVLTLGHYYLATGDSRYQELMNEYLDELGTLASSGVRLQASFCNGLAGFGWMISHLRDMELVDVDDTYFSEIDQALRDHLPAMRATGDLDQIHGMLSLGRYFLKRGLGDDVRYILNTLAETAIHDDREIKWILRRPYKPASYDFGLAHGMAGILYFIGKCYESGIEPELSRVLGDGIIAFFDHNQQEYQAENCYYPYHIEEAVYQSGQAVPAHARLAWCYGDTGILTVIYRYACRIGDLELQQSAIDKLVVTTQRTDRVDTSIRDAQFCHGATGLICMYHRLYADTLKPEFRQAARHWIQEAIAMRTSPLSPTGYVFLKDNQHQTWEPRDTILEGLCGVGLVLTSVLNPNSPQWSEAMMLD